MTALYEFAPVLNVVLSQDGKLNVEVLHRGRAFEVAEVDKFIKLAGRATPFTLEDLAADLGLDVGKTDQWLWFQDFLDSEIIVPHGVHSDLKRAATHWVERGWGEALLFHLKTQGIRYDDMESNDSVSLKTDYLKERSSELRHRGIWKTIPGADYIPLPPASVAFEKMGVLDAVLARRSNRPWTGRPLPVAELSAILWQTAEGMRTARTFVEDQLARQEPGVFCSNFSAQEMYLFVFSVEDLPSGIYHFDPANHSVGLLTSGNFLKEFCEIAIGQQNAAGSAFGVLVTAVWERFQIRYAHEKAYANLLINTGELVQKLLHSATRHDRSTFLTPALRDEIAAELIKVEIPEESPLYVVAIG